MKTFQNLSCATGKKIILFITCKLHAFKVQIDFPDTATGYMAHCIKQVRSIHLLYKKTLQVKLLVPWLEELTYTSTSCKICTQTY